MSKSYAHMTETDRWLWHAEVYAFRRVYLDTHEDQRTNPCDPGGNWHDESLISAAEQRMRAKLADRRRRAEQARMTRDREKQLRGRDIVNRWAQAKGYADIDAYCEATNQPWVDVCTQIVREICASSPLPARIGPSWRSLADCIGGGGKPQPRPQGEHIAALLGVAVREP